MLDSLLQEITNYAEVITRITSITISNEYLRDILTWMKVKESTVKSLKLVSPQLSRRKQLVEWSCSMAARLKLTTQTVHLAIKLLDHFMSGHDIKVDSDVSRF